jgi:metallo-beta-lactamase class B
VFKDGDTIRLGSTEIVAHVTGGHTRGCTSYSFPVKEGDRVLNVVSACSLVVLQGHGYSGYRADFERTFRVLRSLPADIWVTSHGRLWGRYRKFAARKTAKNPVDPFIDPQGYRAYVDSGQVWFRKGIVH